MIIIWILKAKHINLKFDNHYIVRNKCLNKYSLIFFFIKFKTFKSVIYKILCLLQEPKCSSASVELKQTLSVVFDKSSSEVGKQGLFYYRFDLILVVWVEMYKESLHQINWEEFTQSHASIVGCSKIIFMPQLLSLCFLVSVSVHPSVSTFVCPFVCPISG